MKPRSTPIAVRRLVALLLGAGLSAISAPAPGQTATTLSQVPAASPDSPECQRALEAVQAQEARSLSAQRAHPAPAGSAPVISPGLRAARERAARVCLAAAPAAAGDVQRMAQPPQSVAPVAGPKAPAPRPAVPLPAAPVAAPAPAPAPPVVAPRSQQLTTLLGCDPSGCWASDGSRMERAGPNLIGPRGLCTQEGAFLRCP